MPLWSIPPRSPTTPGGSARRPPAVNDGGRPVRAVPDQCRALALTFGPLFHRGSGRPGHGNRRAGRPAARCSPDRLIGGTRLADRARFGSRTPPGPAKSSGQRHSAHPVRPHHRSDRRADRDYAWLAVQDECGGIDPDDLPRVFDRGIPRGTRTITSSRRHQHRDGRRPRIGHRQRTRASHGGDISVRNHGHGLPVRGTASGTRLNHLQVSPTADDADADQPQSAPTRGPESS